MSGRFPLPSYPSGWFRIATSADLKPGQTRSLHYFGVDLVLFRAASGQVGLLDAFCPHLGAHLGLGTVQGDALRCAFHGWLFNAEGVCTRVPGGRGIPPQARGRKWAVCEVNGQIMTYYPCGSAPSWQFPAFPEATDPVWSGFRDGPRWRIRSHPQEILENGVDLEHFSVLHSQQALAAESLALEVDGPWLIHRTFQHYNVFKLARYLGGEVSGPLDVHMYGLGAVVNRTVVDAKIKLSYALAFFLTPIDEELVEFTTFLSMKRVAGRGGTYLLLKKAAIEARQTINQDIQIWESKVYRAQPVLAQGEKRIMPFRRWARQFYDSPKKIEQPFLPSVSFSTSATLARHR